MEYTMKIEFEPKIKPLTFDALPDAVSHLINQVDNIERLLQHKLIKSKSEENEVLVIRQAADFLRLSLPTIYGLVSNRKIPFMKKGKRLYFSKHELSKWIAEGRKKTSFKIIRWF